MTTGHPSRGDGRNIDPRMGSLSGEGAEQKAPAERVGTRGSDSVAVWEELPSDSYKRGYYDRPVLKEPVWIWAVPAYFFVGGAAGAASVLGSVAEMIGGDRYKDLVARCKKIGVGGTSIGGALLIHDLGRPARFLNMLRVFRPTSALNMGSWILMAAGAADTATILFPKSRLFGMAWGLAGLPEAGYSAVLLSDTAVPIWQGTRKTLPLLFVASSAASAASLLEIGELDENSKRAVRVFGTIARATETLAAGAVEREASHIERVGRPLSTGVSGALWRASKLATLAALAIALLPGSGRAKRFVSSSVGIAGGLAMRFAIFHAGVASARDPQATFEQQRAPRPAAEVRR